MKYLCGGISSTVKKVLGVDLLKVTVRSEFLVRGVRKGVAFGKTDWVDRIGVKVLVVSAQVYYIASCSWLLLKIQSEFRKVCMCKQRNWRIKSKRFFARMIFSQRKVGNGNAIVEQ